MTGTPGDEPTLIEQLKQTANELEALALKRTVRSEIAASWLDSGMIREAANELEALRTLPGEVLAAAMAITLSPQESEKAHLVARYLVKRYRRPPEPNK